ncbi:superfamily II DNA/RNA helicase [Inhella inkyongensis]|uniref:Superfamily II DNA/RNA helicase n=1 Tax=Inhella inkyongensis TaxID=392593 RepID=A0A840S7W5_9BURK|nr:DEAD/DEAH box helicase [Inhella inkyongensis]MBB5205106.1 superfamily II DNA/RNA helicase [Inhella inkyongensis]
MSFATLGLSPALLHAVRTAGYHAPTPIQAQAIPAILEGRDVLGLAQTGSGKTAAYALPLLQALQQRAAPAGPGSPALLVLVPTRELALQVAETLRELAQALPQRLRIALAFGGVSINPQLMALRGGSDVLVATPGRLLDLIEHNGLHLRGLRTLVLDEADRLLATGFEEEWQRIQALMHGARQTLLFSATLPDKLKALAQGLLNEPLEIHETQQLAAIHQRALQVDAAQRTPLLRHLLKTQDWQRVLVFVATRYATEHVAAKLWDAGFQSAALHGELSQGGRREVLDALKAGKVKVLVATDVAARGLHIDALDAVVNYELPRSPADYTHRIGRTGRAGANGVAVSFICADSATNAESHFRVIEKRQGQRLAREQLPGFEPKALASEVQATGGIKGKRPSKKDKLRAAGLLPPAQS